MRIKIKYAIKSIYETATKVKKVMEKECDKQKQDLKSEIVEDLNDWLKAKINVVDLIEKWEEYKLD